ncbi:MAG: hypothetical protein Q8O86_06645 [Dehalococcoidia bacterium]|nr:hypothetical protein [Dehalococcoidia bacterium]
MGWFYALGMPAEGDEDEFSPQKILEGSPPYVLESVTTQPLRHQGTKKVMEYKPLSESEEEIAKAIHVNPIWETNLLRHLKLTGTRLGFLSNFNVPVIKKGVKRFVV